MKHSLALGAASLAFLASGCSSLVFTAANAPAHFGEFRRTADIAYAPGPRHSLDVYVPTRGTGTRPIVVFWYGGGWEQGRKSQYRFVGAALAEAGYVAVLPDYRLYAEARFPAFIEDGAAALAWVVSHAAEIGGDPGRVYLAGHSAGAHLAAMLAYDPRWVARAGVPAGSIHGFIGMSGPYALDPDEPVYRAIFSAPYGLDDWQPVRLARAGSPPALLLHGEVDTVVSVAHAEALRRALETAGVEAGLRIYPGRGHRDTVAALAALAPHKLPVMAEIRRFIDGTRVGDGGGE
jgi:acetyl esterase/lipase